MDICDLFDKQRGGYVFVWECFQISLLKLLFGFTFVAMLPDFVFCFLTPSFLISSIM